MSEDMSEDMKEDIKQSNIYYRNNDFFKAIIHFNNRYRTYIRRKQLGNVIQASILQCKFLIIVGKYDKAVRILEKYLNDDIDTAEGSLSIFPMLECQIYHFLGQANFLLGNYKRSLDLFNSAIDIKEGHMISASSRALSFMAISRVYRSIGDYDQAIINLYRAIPAFYIDYIESNDFHYAIALMELSKVYWWKDEIPDADRTLNQARECLIRSTLPSDHILYAQYFNQLGLNCWKRGKQKSKYKTPARDRIIGKAIQVFNKGLTILEKLYPKENHPSVGIILNNMGNAFTSLEEMESAVAFLNKSLKIYHACLKNPHPYIGRVHNDIGYLWRVRKDYDSALISHQSAIYSVVDDFDVSNIQFPHRNPDEIDLTKINSFRVLLTALELKAGIYIRKYENTRDFQFLLYAKAALEKAYDMLTKVSQFFYDKGVRFFYEKSAKAICEYVLKMTDYLIEPHENKKADFESMEIIEQKISSQNPYNEAIEKPNNKIDTEASIEFAFNVLEFYRVISLLEDLRQTQIQNELFLDDLNGTFNHIPRWDKELRSTIENIKKNISSEYYDMSELIRYQKKMDSLSTLLKSISEKNFDFQFQKGEDDNSGISSINLKELQEKAMDDKHVALISFFKGKRDIFAFLISKEYARFFNLTTGKNIKKNNTNKRETTFDSVYHEVSADIKELKQILKEVNPVKIQKQANNYQECAYNLYYRLFKPFESAQLLTNIKRVYLLPDEQISNIPFEALIYEKTKSKIDFGSLNYLLKRDFVMSYHYSATVLCREYSKTRRPHVRAVDPDSYDFIGFAPINFNANKLEDLLESGLALKELKKLFKTKDFNNVITFHREEATLDNYWIYAKKSRVIHIKSHITNTSCIHFYGASKESELNIDDVVNDSSLNAELIFLCGCSSGTLTQKTGVISLNRAYIIARVRNVICTLLDIKDVDLTYKLIYNFYSEMLDGKPFSESLKKAKIDALNGPMSAFPVFWAGFIFIGDQASVFKRD